MIKLSKKKLQSEVKKITENACKNKFRKLDWKNKWYFHLAFKWERNKNL